MNDPRAGIDVCLSRLLALRGGAARTALSAQGVRRPGGFAGRRRGAGLDLLDVRPFVNGDDLRHVDAAATARTGRLQVRTFHEEEERAVLLVADFRRPMLWGTRGRLRSVAAAEALAAIGWRIADAGGKVGLLCVWDGDSLYLVPRERERAMIAVAGGLERAHRMALDGGDGGEVPPLGTTLERVVRLASGGAMVVCATGLDVPGGGFEAAAGALANRARLVFLIVRDALEVAPPAAAIAYFGDDGANRFGVLSADTGNALPEALARAGAEAHVVRADMADLASLADVVINRTGVPARWTPQTSSAN